MSFGGTTDNKPYAEMIKDALYKYGEYGNVNSAVFSSDCKEFTVNGEPLSVTVDTDTGMISKMEICSDEFTDDEGYILSKTIKIPDDIIQFINGYFEDITHKGAVPGKEPIEDRYIIQDLDPLLGQNCYLGNNGYVVREKAKIYDNGDLQFLGPDTGLEWWDPEKFKFYKVNVLDEDVDNSKLF